MLFNSFEYLVFLPLVVLLYFLLPFRWRNPVLLVVSYYFYMCWKWEFGFLILLTSMANYIAGLRIAGSTNVVARRFWLAAALSVSLGILFYFKYANFFIGSLAMFLQTGGFRVSLPVLSVVLPVGVSFFTFQALSYTIDVYKGTMHRENNLVDFLVFVSFFPQLVAGPIERASHLLNQFKERHHFSLERIVSGSRFIIWGLFKKVVIADRLAIYTDTVYALPEQFGGSTLLLATFFFAIQIYCDFSGYSDIAIGSAHMLGFRLMQNFNLPYLARSISDFWKRWHISLSTWFGDYLYKPLGGNRVSRSRWIFNIMVVFLVSGLWHGANWTFVAWGALHGFYYLVEFVFSVIGRKTGLDKRLEAVPFWPIVQTAYVFSVVVLAWVFFRANTLGEALFIVSKIVSDFSSPLYTGSSAFDTTTGLTLVLLLFLLQLLQYNKIAALYFQPSRIPQVFRWVGYACTIILIGLLGVSSEQFIYFQF